MTHSDVDRALRNVLPSKGDRAATFKFLNCIYDLENWLRTNNLVVADAAGPRETGSYKENGALFAAYQLKKSLGSATKVVTASAGNHALGVARASNILDLDATIVVPTTAPLVKVDTIHTILRRGAEEAKSRNVVRVKELVLYGCNFDQANAFAQAIAATKG
ncbi:pyridoxal-phosphate dependent enzyme [bacterium]|nr:pyridoxal-phosphate dependent enzyme [bacterium]